MDYVLYDFDETLTMRDTTRLFVRAMWQGHPLRVLRALPVILAVRCARGAPERLQSAKFVMLGGLLRGLSQDALAPVHRVYVAQVRAMLRSEVWAGMEAHLAAGRQVLVVTASPRLAVQAIFEALSQPVSVIGTEFATARGGFTGALEGSGCYGAEKETAIRAWAARQPEPPRFVEAWSDSLSDAPMMKMAEARYWICPPGDAAQIQREDPTGFIYSDRKNWKS